MEQLDKLYRLKKELEAELSRQDTMSDRIIIREELRTLSKEITKQLGIRVAPLSSK